MIAAVESIKSIERNFRLGTLCGHESCSAIERDFIDDKRAFVAAITNNIDCRRIIDKVLCEGV